MCILYSNINNKFWRDMMKTVPCEIFQSKFYDEAGTKYKVE